MKAYGIAIHGGAGTIRPGDMTTELKIQNLTALQVQQEGYAIDNRRM